MTIRPALLDALQALDGTRILCVGDIMLDRFIYGAVERVSPEAPIPVLHARETREMLGGVGNVVRNLAALGIGSTLAGVVGDDVAGQVVRRLVAAERSIGGALTDDPARRTTVKTRFVSGSQQLLRMDEEDSGEAAVAVQRLLIAEVDAALPKCGALILSDYGKGVLSGTHATNVLTHAIAAANAVGHPVVVDPKGDDYTRYRGADLLTPNRNELHVATRMPVDGTEAIVAAAQRLIETCGIGSVLVTRGADGMTLVSSEGAPVHLPALAREVFDVSGAGDTVVAVIAAGLAAGLEAAVAAELANVAAGIVVGKAGTAVVHRDELMQALAGAGAGGKVLSRPALADRVAGWRQQRLTVGFTNGCFDLIHPGHISLLDQAAAACDRLVVAINADASVARLKGPARPVQNEAARSLVLAALGCVDAVVTFTEDTPLTLIEAIRPDVLVKGADYARADVVGGDFVESYGGKVVLARIEAGFSTTATIARFKQ